MIEEFGPQGMPEHVNRALWEETKGNPFFLEEMVRHLGSGPERAEGNGAPWPLELPEGIREVIGRRLATLSERTSTVLTTAAVIGREFRIELLEAMGPHDEDELDEVVEESVAAHVIAEVPGVYGRCSFTHSLIRQTLYDGLTETRRARLHLRVGEALEKLDNGAGDPPLAELAHHFFLAPPQRGAPKAVDYAERAAQRATGLLAYEEAARLYEVALRALEHAPRRPGAPLRAAARVRRRADQGRRRRRRARDVPRGGRHRARARLPAAARAGGARLRRRLADGRRRRRRARSCRCSRRRSPRSASRSRPCARACSPGSRSSSASPTSASGAPSSAARRSRSPAASATRADSASRCRAPLVAVGPDQRAGAPEAATTCSAWPSAPVTSGSRRRGIAGA